MGKKKKKPKAAGASASADNDEAGVEVDWKEVADRVDRALDETLALPGALANLPTALPDVKLANCDLAAEGYVNVSFTGPKQYNALIESGIVYRVCGPCAEAEVHTSHDHNLLIRPRHYTTEGGVPEPIAVFYAGIFKATGLLIVGYVGGGVQSTVVAQYLAQKALVQLTQPEVYRSPTELGMGSLSIAMGTAFDEATLQQLGTLTTTQLQARFPLEQDRTYMNVDPGDRRAPLPGDAKLRCMTDHDFAMHYQMLPGLQQPRTIIACRRINSVTRAAHRARLQAVRAHNQCAEWAALHRRRRAQWRSAQA